MSETNVISVNFGLLHRKMQFNYEIDLERLPAPLKQYQSDLEHFTLEDLHLLRWKMAWKALAREKQLPPKEFEQFLKFLWIVRSGRGWGKTLVGANWLGLEAASYASMYAVVAPTGNDVRWVNFEGPTGLHAVIPPQLIRDKNLALPSLTLWNGSVIRGFAGDTPERLRGPQHAKVLGDEISSWQYAQDAWDNIMFGLRLGDHPQMVVVGTPKPSVFIRDLMKRKDAVVVVGSTYENSENLTPSYFENVAKYEGTRKGRQEIHGEVLDPEEAGIVKRSQWKRWPADKPLPRFQYIVYSLDTAFTEKDHDKKKQTSDPTACSVWGLFSHGTPAKKNILLLDCWEEWLGFPALIKRVKRERTRRYGAILEGPVMMRPLIGGKQVAEAQGKKIDLILIEDKASGRSLIQSLAAEEIFAEPYNPGGQDKLERLNDTARLWTHGRVWAVESNVKPGEFRNWAEPLIAQVCTYSGEGSLTYDDLLDTATQAAKYFLDNHIGSLTIPRDEEEERRKAALAAKQKLEAKRKRNPYDG